MIFKGEMTKLNTYIQAERSNKFVASKIKKQETDSIIWTCRKYKEKIVDYPVIIEANWFTKNERVDSDNITFSKKWILDGLVKAGIIKDDSRKYVRIWRDIDIFVDKDNPRVVIEIKKYEQNI